MSAEELGLPKVKVADQLDFSRVMQSVDDIVQGIYAHETPDVFENMGIDNFGESMFQGVEYVPEYRGDFLIVYRVEDK